MAEWIDADSLLGLNQPASPKKGVAAGPTWQSADELLGSPPEQRTFFGDVKGFLKEKVEEVPAALASVGSFVTAGPGMAVGAVAGAVRAGEQMLKGKGRREALQEGIETSGRVGHALNPVEVAKSLLGYEPEPTVLDSVMEKLTKAIHHYGEKVEVGTNRTLLAEDIDLFAQLLMGAGMGKATYKGAKAGVDKATAPPKAGTSMEDMAPPRASAAPEVPGQPPVSPAGAAPYRQPMTPEPKTAAEAIAESKRRIKDMKAAVKDELPEQKAARMGGAPSEGTATWTSGGVDYPVNILGPIEMGADGRPYRRVSYEGNESYVPADQLSGHKVDVPLEKSGPTPVELNVVDRTGPPTEGELAFSERQHKARWEAEKARNAMEEDLAKRDLEAPLTPEEKLDLELNPRGGAKGRRFDRWGNALAVGGVTAGAALMASQETPEDQATAGLTMGALASVGARGKFKFEGVPESSILEAVRKGGPEGEAAAAHIVKQTEKRLDRVLNSYFRGREAMATIDDIKQDAYFKLFQALKKGPDEVGGFKGDSSINTFLHSIAVRKAMNAQRTENYRPKTELTPEMEESALLANSVTPESIALHEEMATAMEGAIEKLPQDFREAFWMAEVEGLSYAEGAAKLGIPVATFASRIFRAKERLQKLLKEYNLDAKTSAVIGGSAALAASLDPEATDTQIAAAGIFVPALAGHPTTKTFIAGEQAGLSRTELWKKTQTARLPSGGIFREIPDPSRGLQQVPAYKGSKTLVDIPKGKTLGDILSHPKLFKVDPDLRKIKIGKLPETSDNSGTWDEANNTIWLKPGRTYEEVYSTVLHETGHVVQGKSNWWEGGSPGQFLRPGFMQDYRVASTFLKQSRDALEKRAAGKLNYFDLEDAFNQQIKQRPLGMMQQEALAGAKQTLSAQALKDYFEAWQEVKELEKQKNAAYDSYKKLGGEAQSRAIQNRLFMTQAELRDIPPWQDLERQYGGPQGHVLPGQGTPRGYDVPENLWLEQRWPRSGTAPITAEVPPEAGASPPRQAPPRSRETGSTDPELPIAMAAVGGGAAIGYMLDPENSVRNGVYGALLGGVLGTGAGRGVLKEAIRSPDAALGAISTRLGNIAPELKFALRAHELRVLQGVDRANDAALPFVQSLKKLPKEVQQIAARALLNGDTATIKQLPGVAATFPAVRKLLDNIGAELQGLGRFGEGVSEYFPRIVKDFEGLKKAMGQEAATGLEKRLIEAEATMIRKKGRSLTDIEQSIIVNNYLYAPDQTSFQPGYAKTRKMKDVPEQLQQFYEPPTESLLRYISGAINDIETARFFGRDLKTKGKNGKVFTDVDSSIGNLTTRLLEDGRITQAQAMELRDMLKARFEGGEKGMSTPLAGIRNITNTGLLGNVASAATQIGDSFNTIYHHGLTPTLQAVTQRIIGKQQVTPKQLGLINHVAEELSEMGMTGRALHVAMKYSGFKAIDMFAKGLGLNAALIKNQKLVASPEGAAKFRAKYQAAFGERTDALISDLRAGRRTPETDTLAFSELSDAQPVSKAEMTELYLKHPNGRLLYQLKTYMLKQTDIIRRDAYQEIAKGTPEGVMRGTKNLAALATVYALANVPGDAVKDLLAGRDVDPFTTPKLVENVFQTFGVNRYAGQQLGQGKVVETVLGLATPPVRVIQDLAKLDAKSASYVPIVGRPLYERFGGGNEKREIYDRQFTGKADRKPLSPEARAYLRNKRLDAKRKEREKRLAP